MIVGLGIDLVELDRVERMLGRWQDRLLAKIMTPAEAQRLPKALPSRVLAVASAIALKEAASKAIGTGWSRGVIWKDVRAFSDPPCRVELSRQAALVSRQLGANGGTTAVIEVHGNLVVAEVRLLSRRPVAPGRNQRVAKFT